MRLDRYLILPGLYTKEPELKISQAILSVFVVALLTAGYSFTALLCFACRDEIFQADSIFLYLHPAPSPHHCAIANPPRQTRPQLLRLRPSQHRL